MAKRRDGVFWPSYVDLMTGLFAVMLVLFVLSYKSFSDEKKKYEVKARQYELLREIEESVKNLQGAYFTYQEEYKRHVLNRPVLFDVGKSEIKPEYRTYLVNAGFKIADLIRRLGDRDDLDVRYLVVVEGMASKDDYEFNYELSYARAKALYDFWRDEGISFDPEICEVLIAGSGVGGVGRASREERNQRFLIQIIPKIGER
jgi:outer membrane protein OmpA-like peptidoglycan-associated protein